MSLDSCRETSKLNSCQIHVRLLTSYFLTSYLLKFLPSTYHLPQCTSIMEEAQRF